LEIVKLGGLTVAYLTDVGLWARADGRTHKVDGALPGWWV